MMDWDKYRSASGEIDLIAAYKEWRGKAVRRWHSNAERILGLIMDLQPIQSRQAAASAIVQADWIARAAKE